MSERAQQIERLHQHSERILHVFRQRDGVPYEMEQKVCPDCRRVLDERPLRRAAA